MVKHRRGEGGGEVEVEESSPTRLGLVDGLTTAETSEVLELQVFTTGVSAVTTTSSGGDTRGGVHQLEGQVSRQVTTNSTTVDLDPHGVRHDDTVGVVDVLTRSNDGGGGQVGVSVLQLAVQGNARLALIGRCKRSEVQGLLEAGTWGNGTSLLRLQTCNLASEHVVGHGDLHMLDDGTFHVLDRLLAAVVDADSSVDLLTVVEDLFVESYFHVELPGGQSEALGHEGAGLTLVTSHGGELHLPDGEADGVALMGLLASVVAHEEAEIVDDAHWLARIVVSRVELDGAGSILREGHREGVSIPSELLNEAFLHSVGLAGVARVHLLGGELHLLAEAEAHDLILLASKTVRDRDGREDLPTSEVVIVADYDAIDRFSSGGVIHKVTTT